MRLLQSVRIAMKQEQKTNNNNNNNNNSIQFCFNYYQHNCNVGKFSDNNVND